MSSSSSSSTSSSSSSSDEEEQPLSDNKNEEVPAPHIVHHHKNMDDFMSLGKYCLFVLVVVEFMTMTSLISMIYMVFAGANPNVVGCGEVTFNDTDEACARIDALRASTGCVPILEYQFLSVNVEFEHICGDAKIVKNSISLQMFGVLVGAVFFGQLSDMFGRKKTLLMSLLGLTVGCICNAYVPTFFWFTVFRVINGFFTGGLTVVQGVFMIENIPKKHRMWITTTIAWSPNFIIFPYIAYHAWDWRMLLKVNAVVSAVAAILLLALYESPRFLVQTGKIDEAREVFRRIRKINGDICEVKSSEIEEMLKHEQHVIESRTKKQRKHTYYHIVCTWKMMIWTVILCFGIMNASLVNYGLMFNMEKLSGSLYWNNVILGIIRWSMNIAIGISDYFLPWFGRKPINLIADAFNSIALSIVIYMLLGSASGGWLVSACTIGVTAMCSQMYIAKFMACNELYPTSVRNLAVSALAMCSRVGTIVAPQLFYLSDIHSTIPYIILCAFTFVDLLGFQFFIPETKGRNLENHLPPKEQRIFYRRKSHHPLPQHA